MIIPMFGLSVAIAGASGYAGGEVLRLLSTHPILNVTTVTGRSSSGRSLGEMQPHLSRFAELRITDTTVETLADHDVVFLALPHGNSGPIAEDLGTLSPDTIIVDLAADHRLISAAAFEEFYGGPHPGTWDYGLPEMLLPEGRKQRENLTDSTRIAAPGCNVTAVTLGLGPLIAHGLVDPTDLTAVLANGTSGAGRALKPHLLASEVLGSASPYGVGGVHRHVPEIEQNLNLLLGEDPAEGPVRISFTPTLVPMSRGILATLSAPVMEETDAAVIGEAFAAAYSNETFVRVLPEGRWPATASTVGTNLAQIQWAYDRRAGRVVVVVALDNLVRGTAGQALQSAHIALDIDETLALPIEGVAP